MTQPILVEGLCDGFLDELRYYSTPASPGIVLQITNDKNEMVDEESVRTYRSRVGKL